MTNLEFCYWLNGYFELTDKTCLNKKQVQIIKDHLALVFNKVTPNRDDGFELLLTKHSGNSSQGLCGIKETAAKHLKARNEQYCAKKM